MIPNNLERLEKAIKLQENVIKVMEKADADYLKDFDVFLLESLKELMEYKKYNLSPEVCLHYKIFEDECIRDGVTFKDILRLKDQLKEGNPLTRIKEKLMERFAKENSFRGRGCWMEAVEIVDEECEKCLHHESGKCDTWCDYGEAFEEKEGEK